MDNYIVVTFESVNFAMQTESILKDKKILHQIIPTPREITLSCGLSIRSDISNLGSIRELMQDNSIRVKNIYSFEKDAKNKKMKLI